MEATILKKTKNVLIIAWSKKDVGFGELTMRWNHLRQIYEIDSELMGVDTIIEIFKAIDV